MKRKIFSILFALVLVLSFSLVTAVSVTAATPIYVNTSTGNDAWDGEAAVWDETHGPKATIGAGISVVDPGGTVYVAAGIYTENVVLPQGKSLTLLGAQANIDPRGGRAGAETILDGGGYSSGNYGIKLQDTTGADIVTINGFTIRNYEYGIWGHFGTAFIQNLTVSYNVFENNGDPALPNVSGWNHDGGAIRIDNVDHSIFSYNEIKNGERGIRLDDNAISGSDYNTVEYNLIHDLQQYGVGLYDCANNNTVRRNVIYNCPDRGIQLWGTNTGNKFLNNEVYNVTNDGILLHNSTNAEIKDNQIYNVAFTDETWSGDYTQNGGPASGFGYQPVHGGIAILGTSSNIVITGNDIHDNGVLGAGWPAWNGQTSWATSCGIWAQSTESIAILNNTISSFKKSGIVVKDALSVQIEGNTISTTDHSVAPNGIQIGYVMDYTETTGTVNDNQISGCYWDGYDPETEAYEDDWTGSGILVIAPNSELTISGNEVQSSDVGLDIEAGSGTSIQGNYVHDNSYGFVSWNADPTINYNSIYENSLCGVYRTYDLTNTLDAEKNWWGDCSGPSTVGPGTGDAVSANVDYDPWLGKQLCELKVEIAVLSDDDFTKPKAASAHRQALLDKIDAVCGQIEDGAYRGALNKLQHDVINKIEKWIVPAEQTVLIDKVNAEIVILENFL